MPLIEIREERRVIERWLAFVEAMHRDQQTVEILRSCLLTGRWSLRMVHDGGRILDTIDDERC